MTMSRERLELELVDNKKAVAVWCQLSRETVSQSPQHNLSQSPCHWLSSWLTTRSKHWRESCDLLLRYYCKASFHCSPLSTVLKSLRMLRPVLISLALSWAVCSGESIIQKLNKLNQYSQVHHIIWLWTCRCLHYTNLFSLPTSWKLPRDSTKPTWTTMWQSSRQPTMQWTHLVVLQMKTSYSTTWVGCMWSCLVGFDNHHFIAI